VHARIVLLLLALVSVDAAVPPLPSGATTAWEDRDAEREDGDEVAVAPRMPSTMRRPAKAAALSVRPAFRSAPARVAAVRVRWGRALSRLRSGPIRLPAADAGTCLSALSPDDH
jgi:hypothetical protein